jgi:hypothetical protein
MADMIVVITVCGMLVVGMLSFGHFTEEFGEFVFVLAHARMSGKSARPTGIGL